MTAIYRPYGHATGTTANKLCIAGRVSGWLPSCCGCRARLGVASVEAATASALAASARLWKALLVSLCGIQANSLGSHGCGVRHGSLKHGEAGSPGSGTGLGASMQLAGRYGAFKVAWF